MVTNPTSTPAVQARTPVPVLPTVATHAVAAATPAASVPQAPMYRGKKSSSFGRFMKSIFFIIFGFCAGVISTTVYYLTEPADFTCLQNMLVETKALIQRFNAPEVEVKKVESTTPPESTTAVPESPVDAAPQPTPEPPKAEPAPAPAQVVEVLEVIEEVVTPLPPAPPIQPEEPAQPAQEPEATPPQ